MNKFYKFEFFCAKCRALAYSDYESTRLCHECEMRKRKANRKVQHKYKKAKDQGDYYLSEVKKNYNKIKKEVSK